MKLDDAFERCLGLLFEDALDDALWPAVSALIDEARGVGGNALTVGEGTGGEDRIQFARLLSRGECRQDLAREYFEVHYPNDAGMRRLMDRPEGRLVHPCRRPSRGRVHRDSWCGSLECVAGGEFSPAMRAAKRNPRHAMDRSGADNAHRAPERALGTEKSWSDNRLRRHRGGAGRESAKPFCAR